MKRPHRSLRDEATDLVIPRHADLEFDLAARCRDAVRATIQVLLDEQLVTLVVLVAMVTVTSASMSPTVTSRGAS